jgi:hypothetical protein
MRILLLLLVACDATDLHRGGGVADAPNLPADAFDPAQCLVQAHYGAIEETATFADETLTLPIDSDPPVDGVTIRLAGAPGTYPIDFDDDDTCTICVDLHASAKLYHAVAGTLTFDAAAPPMHVWASGLELFDTGDTCKTDIATLTVTAN